METFDSTKRNLIKILEDVNSGKIQLPDFQRGWVWDDDRIKGVIASIAKSFPIGAIMLLETGSESIKFKTKPIEGVILQNDMKPELLILDGQQRITSLYQSIFSTRVVVTRNEKNYEIKRWYYIDMKKAVDNDTDLEDAIFSINENKIRKTNFGRDIDLNISKPEYEYQNLMFPVHKINKNAEWRIDFQEHWSHDRDKSIFWNEFERKIVKNFESYQLPIITLKKENPKEAVCQVFEKVNTGGVSLTVFELLTSTFASDGFDLKDDWNKIKKQFEESQQQKILTKVGNTDIIQAVTLLASYKHKINGKSFAVGCKRRDVLKLCLEDYKENKELVVKSFIKAAKILSENNLFTARDLPYNSQLIPMSCILAILENNIENIGKKTKLMQWFWCGVFGELYGSTTDTRFALDLPQVVKWIENNGEEPRTISDSNFSPDRLYTLKTRNSAAYKGIYALLMDDKAKDWLTATKIDFATYFSEAIDIHHIFPVNWCKKNNIERNKYDCIVNKTPLSSRTNRIVGGEAPSSYLSKIQKKAGIKDDDEFNEILKSHVLSPEFLYNDNFESFFNDRKEQILKKIERATNKSISRESSQYEEGKFIDSDQEEYDKT